MGGAAGTISAREQNRRIKQAIAALKASGATRVAVEFLANGSTRVVEVGDEHQQDDEAARVGRLIEERMGLA